MKGILTQHIKRELGKSRNFCGLFIGRVGTGKSYSALKMAENLDPSFNIDRIVFNIPALLDLAQKLQPGNVIIFDEAGISGSNRNSYMNTLNKSLSFLLQTWRHRQIILFVTIPDIAFIDKGVRKMFDIVLESKGVVKKRKIVKMAVKFVQVNFQSGKAYFKSPRSSSHIVNTEIGKPSLKLINRYEKAKTNFTTELYKSIQADLKPEEKKTKELDERRCKECGNLGDYKRTKELYLCRKCPNQWPYSPPKPAIV